MPRQGRRRVAGRKSRLSDRVICKAHVCTLLRLASGQVVVVVDVPAATWQMVLKLVLVPDFILITGYRTVVRILLVVEPVWKVLKLVLVSDLMLITGYRTTVRISLVVVMVLKLILVADEIVHWIRMEYGGGNRRITVDRWR